MTEPAATTPASLEILKISRKVFDPLFPYNTLLSVPALILNSFVIFHYLPQRNKFVPSTYLLISSCDCLMTLGILLQALLLQLLYSTTLVESWPLLLSVAVIGLALRCSVFGSVLLAVARTIKIVSPFYPIKRKVALGCVVSYTAFWVGVASYDVYTLASSTMEDVDLYTTSPFLGKEAATKISVAGCSDEECVQSEGNEMLGRRLTFSLSILGFVVPCVIVLVCMVLQVAWLRRPSPGDAASQRHVTITILLLTAVFFVCNSATSIWFVLDKITDVLESTRRVSRVLYFMLVGMTITTVPLLNAVLSPLIIVLRSAQLKKALMDRLLGARRGHRDAPSSTGAELTNEQGIIETMDP